MNLVTVAPSIPSPESGGGGNWNASLIKYFAREGHKVTHIAVIGKHASIAADSLAIEAYRRLGVEIVIVPYRMSPYAKRSVFETVRLIAAPTLETMWPAESSTRPFVLDVIEKIRPDCVLPFAFDAVLYTHGLQSAPRFGVQAEGPHINTDVTWRFCPDVERGASLAYAAYTLKTMLIRSLQEKLYVQLTGALTIAGFQGPHYVEWARKKRLNNAVFVTTPVADPVGTAWEELRAAHPPNAKVRILMIGHLHSTSNKSGLPIFFEEVLPGLERQLGRDWFEIHIVGRNDGMPSRFDKWRKHPSLVFRGPVYPAHDEFLKADILLVTVPAPTGSRVRIINGFSYGCCVVAHQSNALGIPELVHDHNVLLGENAQEIVQQVERAAGDPALRRRLGKAGRDTYEERYTEDFAGKQYLALIEDAIRRGNR